MGVVTGLRPGEVQDLLEVELERGGVEALVPFVEEIVPEVDVEAGTLTLTPPPGLLELALEPQDAPDPAPADGER